MATSTLINGVPREAKNELTHDQATTYGHHALHDKSQRPLHVVISGAGPTGLALAIELKNLNFVTFEIHEKNADVGGTWFENRYPGAACDVASHAYQYTFEPKYDWTRHFAPAEEIGKYFIHVAQKYDLYKYISLNSKIDEAVWSETDSKWTVRIQSSEPSNSRKVQADIFINAGGILNNWKWPDIVGLQDFRGALLHTAAWDKSFNWNDKNVAVIGSGATGIQVVPQMQKTAKKVDVFVRSPTYIIPTVGFGIESSSFNEPYLDSEKERFAQDQQYYKIFRKRIEQQMNENFLGSVKNSQKQQEGRQWAEDLMRQSIVSEELQQKLIPSWELGCRRLTPGQPYLLAVQQPNVHIERSAIRRITKTGIETVDGNMHEVDAIVCATGFDTSFTPPYDIVGLNAENLRNRWAHSPPEAYLGLAVSGFPNYYALLGPNCPIANGSLVPCIESSAKYVVQVLTKMATDQIKTLDVKRNIQDAFNKYAQSLHKDLVWSGSCQSWYKDRKTGQVTAVWPGSSIHYMEMIETPRWEDYELQYSHGNPFMFLGNGTSQREAKSEDLTYYLDHMGI